MIVKILQSQQKCHRFNKLVLNNLNNNHIDYFKEMGVNEKYLNTYLKNELAKKNFKKIEILQNPEQEEVWKQQMNSKKMINLVLQLTQDKNIKKKYLSFLYDMIVKQQITNNTQLNKVLKGIKDELRLTQQVDMKKIVEKATQVEEIKKKDKNTNNEKVQEVQELKFWDKIHQVKGRDIDLENNKKEIYEQHLKETGGQIVLRFPPEPNGYLHLGHIKSMVANFETAERLNGKCYLRFDDTNPESEKQEYIDNIISSIEWMGYKPYEITYSSDYFDRLYDCAVQLIKKGKAYVCDLDKQIGSYYKRECIPSPYRDRSVEENLELFEQMKNGQIEEGKKVLRAKIQHDHPNTTMRDPAIYRIKFMEHPKSGNKWVIYPLYDFTHGLCDSFQNITHSLCTLEFDIRRDLYYWFLHELDLYKPLVYEFSRLNVSHNFLSKRKIKALIDQKIIQDWHDPRLLTINGLKNRGLTPQSLKNFVIDLNITRTGNENIISQNVLNDQVRKDLQKNSVKITAVVDPVKLIITNLEDDYKLDIEINKETKVTVEKEIFIDRKDIVSQEITNLENFYGIQENKQVCLKFYGVVECEKIVYQDNGNEEVVKEVHVKLITTDFKQRKKIKGQLHWINKNDSMEIGVIDYDNLFEQEDPSSIEIEELPNLVNKNNKVVYENSLIHKNDLLKVNFEENQRFQFDRLGYYYLNKENCDIQNNKYSFNKIVGLYQAKKNKV